MLNLGAFSNIDEISRKDFDILVKSYNLEVYSQEAIQKYVTDISNLMEKSEEGGGLSGEEKNAIEIAKAEISNLKKYTVLDVVEGKLVKLPLYVQSQMVDIEKGVYVDNPVNRKLGRVGRQWGGKKEDGKKKPKNKIPDYLDGQEVKLSQVLELMNPSDLEKLGIKNENSEQPIHRQMNDMVESGIKQGVITEFNKDGVKYLRFGKEKDQKFNEDFRKKITDHMDDEGFYDTVAEIAGEPEDDGESESALIDRLSKLPKEKKEKFLEKLKGNDTDSHKVGDTVKIPKNLTTDPSNKQGEKGVITNITKYWVSVKFEDGKVGRYDIDALEKVSKK